MGVINSLHDRTEREEWVNAGAVAVGFATGIMALTDVGRNLPQTKEELGKVILATYIPMGVATFACDAVQAVRARTYTRAVFSAGLATVTAGIAILAHDIITSSNLY